MAISFFNRRVLHPAVSILCWLIYALTVEWAKSFSLAGLATLTLLVCIGQPDTRSAFLRLLKRSRWLLLSLAAVYAWTIPGTWVWPQLGGLSPSLEGLALGGERIIRLSLLLAALALLLQKIARDDLVYGLYMLAWPFARLGFDRRAFAVRLALAMEWTRSSGPGSRPGIGNALQSALREPQAGPNEIAMQSRSLSWPDGVALLTMLALFGASL
jgi:energy-coupling factor transport system permease protein